MTFRVGQRVVYCYFDARRTGVVEKVTLLRDSSDEIMGIRLNVRPEGRVGEVNYINIPVLAGKEN